MAKIFTEVIRSIQSRPQNASILLRKIIPNYAYGKNICKKLLKTGTQKSEGEHKHYKRLFEQVKKYSKKLHSSNLIPKYRSYTKMKWSVIKEAIGKKVLLTDISSKINLAKKIITY